jgi:DNA invertase Pin-like site-specific DNA recombinase
VTGNRHDRLFASVTFGEDRDSGMPQVMEAQSGKWTLYFADIGFAFLSTAGPTRILKLSPSWAPDSARKRSPCSSAGSLKPRCVNRSVLTRWKNEVLGLIDAERSHALAVARGLHIARASAQGTVAPGSKAESRPPMSARVAIYARVSTSNHGQDAGLQTRDLRQFAEARGWKLEDEYVDSGVSGAKDSRPELNRLMADAKRRRFDTVLVWKLDRFGRSLRHLVNALAEFESLGIAFVSLSDNLDLSTASGRLMFNIIGAMAEFERALIQERVKAGIRNAPLKESDSVAHLGTWMPPQSQGCAAREQAGVRFLLS